MKNRDHLIRQFDLIPEKILSTPITVIGAGAVGSETVMTLAKMGFDDITVFDFDDVAVENISSQMYGFKDIGKPKVEALGNHVEYFSGVNLTIQKARYEGGMIPGILIVAVDNMATRAKVFAEHAGLAVATDLVIDPRMGAEHAALYSYRPTDLIGCASYSKTLYTDEKAIQEPCTAKATSYCSRILAGMIAVAVKNHLTGKPRLRSAQFSIPAFDLLAFHDEEEKDTTPQAPSPQASDYLEIPFGQVVA